MSTPPQLHLLYSATSESISPYDYFTKSNAKSDVILVADHVKFHCHRLILSLVSPVFTRMFDGHFKEHNEQEIVLNGKKSKSILELLIYIYPQFHNSINPTNIEDFLQLSDEYMIDHVKQPCREFLARELEQYKYVIMPTKQKVEQPSLSSKDFHSSDLVLNTDPTSSSNHRLRPTSSSRQTPASVKFPSSKYLKPSSSNTPSKYLVTIDQYEIPKYFDSTSSRIKFSSEEIELWLKRLKILYSIDKTRYFEQIIEHILSLLHFISSTLILPLLKITSPTDEQLLNDLLRARLFFLEEFDGNEVKRLIRLPESYRTFITTTLARRNDISCESSSNEPILVDENGPLLNMTLQIDQEP
ncbi:unnamed protein product [Didymodactylos carnosus]|uniref:BTB domain-containing protein n=1 Tax=Didymodactylos carnosus TaxID=1234261 RepID=A0A813NXH9_9BILA|nr:unnamed protein product [Didymodactylos carnosus]CAF0767767.1 unnamed protein product [Didymodactylos carnosus]CAF3524720.1 unnamed protein product [Didymodactylos carnosus]CAF3548277.1 unnamed protein product [Didymodactylos carnosus]